MKMNTLAEKKAYFEQVKLANFRESSRLEGMAFPTDQARQAMINRYK